MKSLKTNLEKLKPYYPLGGLIVLSLVLIGLLFFSRSSLKAGAWSLVNKADTGATVATATVVSEKPRLATFAKLELIARSALVYDLENKKIIYSLNENESLPLASLTKLMTVYVAAENSLLVSTVTIPDSVAANSGGILRAGERWRLGDLITYALVESNNQVAEAIALSFGSLADFKQMMNNKAAAIGMERSRFINPTGLDEVALDSAGAYGSAMDMVRLLSRIQERYPEILQPTTAKQVTIKSLDKNSYHLLNTNELVDKLPGLIGAKTGFTKSAGGNLAILADVGLRQPVAIVVLGSTKDGRFIDVEKLYWETVRFLTNR